MESKNIVPAFVAKTYSILQDPHCQSAISWTSNGNQFIIKNVHALETHVLPKYFRHHNLNSFIRQLNMYGFHKSRKNYSQIVFSHQLFVQGSPELLQKIKRKTKNQSLNDQNIAPTEVYVQSKDSKVKSNNLLNEQKNVQQVQDNVNLKQGPIEQIQNNHQTINSSTSIILKPLWSLENTIEQFSTKSEYPFRCFIEKSEIFDFKPQLAMNLQITDHAQITHLLNFNNEQEFDNTSIDGDIAERRREMENEAERIPSIRTFNFLNELYF